VRLSHLHIKDLRRSNWETLVWAWKRQIEVEQIATQSVFEW